jgi:hypothetical protein
MKTTQHSVRNRMASRPVAIAGIVSVGVMSLGGWAVAQNAEVLANLKGYGLQQYLNSNRGGGSMPARPRAYTEYAYPQRSVVQVSPLPYQHAVPPAYVFGPQVVQSPAPVILPAQTVVQRVEIPAPPAETKPVAFVQAHLPPGADLFLEDKLVISDAKLPAYDLVTPPLEKGMWYTYTARVRWAEDGKWVGQMHTFDIRAGDIHHLEVTPSTAPSVEKEIAAGLAGLPAADRKAAVSQKFCAVQDTIRLGSMGTPVKVTLDGKDVFLCCKGCVDAAKKTPGETLGRAKGLVEKKPDPAK